MAAARYPPGERSLAESREAGDGAQRVLSPASSLAFFLALLLVFILLHRNARSYAHINQTGQVTPDQRVPEMQKASCTLTYVHSPGSPLQRRAARHLTPGHRWPPTWAQKSSRSSGPEHQAARRHRDGSPCRVTVTAPLTRPRKRRITHLAINQDSKVFSVSF